MGLGDARAQRRRWGLEARGRVACGAGRGGLRGQQRPEHEPALLTIFLVEVESTGTQSILVCNKVELVDEQTRIAEFHPSQQSIGQKVFGGFIEKAILGEQ
ncbi:unnamed protein product [Urochloa humidicola]